MKHIWFAFKTSAPRVSLLLDKILQKFERCVCVCCFNPLSVWTSLVVSIVLSFFLRRFRTCLKNHHRNWDPWFKKNQGLLFGFVLIHEKIRSKRPLRIWDALGTLGSWPGSIGIVPVVIVPQSLKIREKLNKNKRWSLMINVFFLAAETFYPYWNDE